MSEPVAPSSIVVGIDGSRPAIRAALWGVDEAVSRDIPLKLIYVIDPERPHPAVHLAAARAALLQAQTAIEETGKEVKIESEISNGRPLEILLRASRSAEMLCVGSIGLRRVATKVPSTAVGLASSAHCPVAIVPGRNGRCPAPGSIVVHVDGSSTDAEAIAAGIEEARLRSAPVHVVTTCTDAADPEGNRCAQARLARRLACWTKSDPDIDIRAVAFHGTLLEYVTKQRDPVQLVIARMGNEMRSQNLFQPRPRAALYDSDCSMLVVGSPHL